MIHKSVLLQEAIDGLQIKPGDVVIDGTLGGGGHSEEILKRFGSRVTLLGIDLDIDALERTRERIENSIGKRNNVFYFEESFRNLDLVLDSKNLKTADRILLDIGLSSNQFEESGRGFSFQKNEPLIMSFKKDLKPGDFTAKDIVNHWDVENIATILQNYGEEKFAWKIAKAIEAKREEFTIETTAELVAIIKLATPKWYQHKKIHPATKTFQALRITVNDELGSLREGVTKGFERLSIGGRLAVISFHSLEDRLVKQFFKEKSEKEEGKLITKKPIVPGNLEIDQNPRARSAKLRIIEKIK